MSKPPAPIESDGEPTAQEIVDKVRPYLRPEKMGEALPVIQMMVQKIHRGPLPAPEDFAQYEATLPGLGERIVAMAENSQRHHQAMETGMLKAEYGLRSRGQYLAITALIVMLALIGWVFYLGQQWPATILGGGTLATIVGMFLRYQQGEKVVEAPEAKPPAKRSQKQKKR